MYKKESDLQRAVNKYLKTQDGWFYHPRDLRKGIPDLIGVYKGWFVAIELKVGKNTPSKLQEYNLDKIQSMGGRTCVAYTVEEVQRFLKELDDYDRQLRGIIP